MGDLLNHPWPAQKGQALIDVLAGCDAEFVATFELLLPHPPRSGQPPPCSCTVSLVLRSSSEAGAVHPELLKGAGQCTDDWG